MPGDYSRFTDDPKRRISSLLLQQGKVVLDADFNEESLTAEERRRLGALDTFGPAAVSTMVPLNADAFKLSVTGAAPNQDLLIGPGRMWVDGRLVQCFPDDGGRDPADPTKIMPPSYLHQPFLPQPKKPADVAFPAVAYLDVWTREVTWVEEPDLLDKALGGVDTSTRLVTVWQVKLLEKQEGRPDPTCADVLSAFKPSGGRLTTDAVAPPAPDDPCLVSPTGGYRGIENRLYRVQIHEGGSAGTATFKWSRDNASLVSPVTSITTPVGKTLLEVTRIGRDPVLRFDVGDWVELTDDWRELHGQPGEMARVEDVNEATREVLLDRPVAAFFAATEKEHEARHTRLVRWDQKDPPNTLDGNGLMTVQVGTAIPLEDGIEITFDLAPDSPAAPSSGLFHTGDYWVCAARTADGKVDELKKAPPRGIAHNFVPLAEVTGSAATGLTVRQPDCRVFWPPKSEGGGVCCCTVVVRPGEDIQAAIEEVCRQGGGCVCLKAGVHEIRDTIRIVCSGVSLVGESGATVVRAVRLAPLLEIHDPQGKPVTDTIVEGIRFLLVGGAFDAETALVRAQDVQRLGLRDLRIEGSGPVPNLGGILFVHADEIRMERCRIGQVDVGVKALEGSGTLILRDNVLENQGVENQERAGQVAIWLQDARGPCRIEANRIAGFARGIVLSDSLAPAPEDRVSRASGSRIAGNLIVLGAPRIEGDRTVASVGIEVAAEAALVAANIVGLAGSDAYGITVWASAIRIISNRLIHAGQQGEILPRTVGVAVWPSRRGTEAVAIAGNAMRELTVAVSLEEGKPGAQRFQVRDVTVEDNDVRSAAEAAILGRRLQGTVLVSRNRIRFAAFAEPAGEEPRAAVDLVAADDDPECEIILDGCIVEEWGRIETNKPGHERLVIGVRLQASRVAVRHNRIGNPPLADTEREKLDTNLEHRAMLLQGFRSAQPNERLSGKALVLGNQFRGTGRSALVEVQEARITLGNAVIRIGFARVSFSDNEVEHRSLPDRLDGLATCLLQGDGLVVGDNQVKSEGKFASFNLFDNRRATFIGNAMTGEPFGVGGVRPQPPNGFNIF